MEYAVVMAGGAGTRLWPAARQQNPKQLQHLIFEQPLIVETVERLRSGYPVDRILIVTAQQYVGAIAQAVPGLPPRNILSEPHGRNTAAAIALAAFTIQARDPSGLFAVFPSDHVMLDPQALFRALPLANELARKHRVVDIGVPPSHAETGYGYIELGAEIESSDGVKAFVVRRFVEKPDRQTAEKYVAAGNYMWNSGMFVWRAEQYLEALEEHLPQTHAALKAALQGDEEQLSEAYDSIADISVDYAIMEKVADVVAVPVDFGWRDIGDWAALYDLMDHDADGNAFESRHVISDVQGSLLLSRNKLIAALGIQDLVVVDTEDVLLIVPRSRAQEVKTLLDQLKREGLSEYL